MTDDHKYTDLEPLELVGGSHESVPSFSSVPLEEGNVLRLPDWAVQALGIKPGDRLQLANAGKVLTLDRGDQRRHNRGMLLSDGSIRLPTMVLNAAASGPLVFEPLGPGTFRLRPAAPDPAKGTPAAALDAPVSAAGRLLPPAVVIEALGAQPGESIVFGMRDDGSFEVQSLAAVIARAGHDLRSLRDGRSVTEELIDERRAEGREEGVDDPLTGSWPG